MSDLARYLTSRYVDGARGPNAYDCWGLVREVLIERFGVPADHVPAFGHVSADDKRGMTRARNQLVELFQPTEPAPGAVACQLAGRVLVHVGVVLQVNDQLRVLHTGAHYGPSLDRLRRFEAIHTNTVTEYLAYAG